MNSSTDEHFPAEQDAAVERMMIAIFHEHCADTETFEDWDRPLYRAAAIAALKSLGELS